jgi:hypothetical protein
MRLKQPLLVQIFCLILIFSFLFIRFGYEATWQFWNIPVMSPHFADLRAITHLSTTISLGFDPMEHHPGDPWQRPFNYPPVWKLLPLIGVSPHHTTVLGILLIGLFLIGLYLPFSDLSWAQSAYLMFGVLSPAVLLGIERANVDLLIYFLMALAVWMMRRSIAWAAILIQTAVFLKLYPLFGLISLAQAQKRAFLIIIALSLGASTLYFLTSFREILLTFKNTPKSYNLSYGIGVIPKRLERSQFAPYARVALILTSTTAVAIVMVGYFFGRKFDLSNDYQSERYLNAFQVGSAIYIGTFLLGNNFDYRLMFLLLTIPQLFWWWQCPSPFIRAIAKISGIALYLSLWHRVILRGVEWLLPANFAGSFTRALVFFPDELANWVLFCGLVFLFAPSLPRWFYPASKWGNSLSRLTADNEDQFP